MGKKEKKYLKEHGGYDKEISYKIADQLENYLNIEETMVIINDKSTKSIKKAKKVIKQAIKDLRNGREEEVFNDEAYFEFIDGR